MLFYALHPKDRQLISLFEYEKKYRFQIKQGNYPHLLCPSCKAIVTYCRKSKDGKSSHFRAIKGHRSDCIYYSRKHKRTVYKPNIIVLEKRKIFIDKPERITLKLKEIEVNRTIEDDFYKKRVSSDFSDGIIKKSITRKYILDPPKKKKHKTITTFASLVRCLIENPEALTQWGAPLWSLFKNSKKVGPEDLKQKRMYYLIIKNFQQIVIKDKYAFINNSNIQESSIYLSKDNVDELLTLLSNLQRDLREAIVFTIGEAVQSRKNPDKILIRPLSRDSIIYVFMKDFHANVKKFFT